jgi:hypothetical protein
MSKEVQMLEAFQITRRTSLISQRIQFHQPSHIPDGGLQGELPGTLRRITGIGRKDHMR